MRTLLMIALLAFVGLTLAAEPAGKPPPVCPKCSGTRLVECPQCHGKNSCQLPVPCNCTCGGKRTCDACLSTNRRFMACSTCGVWRISPGPGKDWASGKVPCPACKGEGTFAAYAKTLRENVIKAKADLAAMEKELAGLEGPGEPK